jgi:hypothetical protein
MAVSKKMKGNTNAEKWTIEEAEKFCNDVLEVLQTDKKIRTLGGACLKAGGYETLIHYLEEKYNTVFEPIKKSREIVKERLIEQGLDGDANPTMAIFILKNNHNMTDKQQTDITTNGKDVSTTPIIKFVEPEDGD